MQRQAARCELVDLLFAIKFLFGVTGQKGLGTTALPWL